MVNFKKVIRKQGINVLTILVLCGVLLFLYKQSVRVNTENLYRMESLLDGLLFYDSKIEGDMALLLVGRLAHFDTLVEGMNKLAVLRMEIDDIVMDTPALLPSLKLLHAALDAQEEPLEKFKMTLSVELNSIRYLPTLIEQVQHEYPQHEHILTSVYHEVLGMVTQAAEFDDAELKNLIKQMNSPELKPMVLHL